MDCYRSKPKCESFSQEGHSEKEIQDHILAEKLAADWDSQNMIPSIFAEFGKVKDLSPDCEEAVALARKLQDHITEHYYTCTDKILLGLGAMYAGGGDLTTNIDKVGGEGTAVFACEAIKAMIAKK